jgi:putative photosynthetic complex assembly protein
MSDPFANRPFPRGALIGAGALIGFALLAVSAARLGGFGTVQVPEAVALESRELRFLDRQDGAVVVLAPGDARPIEVLAPETNGFVRGVMRSVARERRLQDIGSQQPVLLTLWDDGRLSLEDAATGYLVNLEAFGPTNAGAFARLLGAGQLGE